MPKSARKLLHPAPPESLPTPYNLLMVPSTAWREDIAFALDQLGTPILTVVDEAVWVGIAQPGIGFAICNTLNPGCLTLFLSSISGRGIDLMVVSQADDPGPAALPLI